VGAQPGLWSAAAPQHCCSGTSGMPADILQALQDAKLNTSCQKCVPRPLVKQQGVLGGVKCVGQSSNLRLWNSLSEENTLVLVFGLQGN